MPPSGSESTRGFGGGDDVVGGSDVIGVLGAVVVGRIGGEVGVDEVLDADVVGLVVGGLPGDADEHADSAAASSSPAPAVRIARICDRLRGAPDTHRLQRRRVLTSV